MDIPAGDALLYVRLDIDPALEQDMQRWLVDEQLPALLKLPGFLAVRLFHGISSAGSELPGKRTDWVPGHHRWLMIAELANEQVLQSEGYLRFRGLLPESAAHLVPHMRVVRSVYRQAYPAQGALVPGGAEASTARNPIGEVTLAVLTTAEPAHHRALAQWYDQFHLADELMQQGYVGARRAVRVIDPAWLDERYFASGLGKRWYEAAIDEPHPDLYLALYENSPRRGFARAAIVRASSSGASSTPAVCLVPHDLPGFMV